MLVKILLVIVCLWFIISLISMLLMTELRVRIFENKNLVEEILKTERGKNILSSFNNKVALIIPCCAFGFNILVLVAISYMLVKIKTDYETFANILIECSRGETIE